MRWIRSPALARIARRRYHPPAMESTLPLRGDRSVAARLGIGLLCSLPLLGLLAWHGWMILNLLGAADHWERLVDDRPVISGRHALHLYHGWRTAQAFRLQGTVCCFDPSFQAGYPITPVFDDGARPAALFLTLAGGDFRPGAYKLGLALCCFVGPLLIFLAGRGTGLGVGANTVAVAASLLVWWSSPCRQLLEAGDLGFLLSGLAVVAGAGTMIHYHRIPGLSSWLGVVFSGCVGWFGQPLLFIAFLPLAFIYYLSVGTKHRLGWHVALLCAFAAPLAVHSFWMYDWLSYWWIRASLQGDLQVLAHSTFHTLWTAPFWGSGAERILAGVVLVLAMIGLGVLNETNNRPAARVFGLGVIGFTALALAGAAWEPLARLGATKLLVVALWCAAIPAAYGLAQAAWFLVELCGGRLRAVAVAGCLAGIAFAFTAPSVGAFAAGYTVTPPLAIGLTAEQLGWVKAIQENTTVAARILWEEDSEEEPGAGWTALLPALTGRYFIGGLDANASIEHDYARLCGHCLAGRPLEGWCEAELCDFYRRYNIGWVICRPASAHKCLKDYHEAQPVLFVDAAAPRYLYQLIPKSYVLRGEARLLEADARHIVLADVVPVNGQVVLSFHYQAGMCVSPGRVQIEKECDARDPIDFIRLKLDRPVARVTITWHPER
jgi:hypothetical protein